MFSQAMRQRLEAREAALSPFAAKAAQSRGRALPEPPPLLGTEFQRDRERILRTNAFRRLKHKTQVFIAPLGDHYVTRLTHTLEVALTARTIASALNLNEDLAEAVALGHDLGHTPFGHVGEEALDHLYPGGFKHARQSLRLVEVLEHNGAGLNLTWEVRQGMAAHSKPRGDFLGRRIPPGLSLEAQVCRVSDAIAYVHHDIGDALRSGLLGEEDLPSQAVKTLGPTLPNLLDALVVDVVESSWAATGAAGTSARPTITMSLRVRAALTQLREFMFERIYVPLSRGPESAKAREIVELLYHYFCQHPEGLPPEYRLRDEPVEQHVADYVAGMTDHFALIEAERIQPGISQGVRFMGL
ncbi:MAG: deoxyguanosinetriphosphate triphosphohydrolase [Chloroflexi bacterium]|nr:deoxyguanosinetriphosphate triphosphohydrolase [Chloroflexota bacterium]